MGVRGLRVPESLVGVYGRRVEFLA